MDLLSFDSQLRAACDATVQAVPGITRDDLRPFVCKGSPLLCPVFLVGMNPASADRGFWRYWSVAGFDYASWLQNYIASRREARKRSATSPTRARLQVFTAACEAAGAPVLETNVYAVCAPSKRHLPVRMRDARVFKFLLEAIRPSVIVAHGDDALRALSGIFAVSVGRGTVVVAPDGTTLVGSNWHFSGQGAQAGFDDAYVARLGEYAGTCVANKPAGRPGQMRPGQLTPRPEPSRHPTSPWRPTRTARSASR